MHEGHVDEFAFGWGQGFVEFFGDGELGEGEGHGVICEGLGLVAVDIAGELVEEDDFGEGAFGSFAPSVEFPGYCLVVEGLEALADQCVEVWVFLPPLLGYELLEPEVEDLVLHGVGRYGGFGVGLVVG